MLWNFADHPLILGMTLSDNCNNCITVSQNVNCCLPAAALLFNNVCLLDCKVLTQCGDRPDINMYSAVDLLADIPAE